jgi:hypothetical protein
MQEFSIDIHAVKGAAMRAANRFFRDRKIDFDFIAAIGAFKE